MKSQCLISRSLRASLLLFASLVVSHSGDAQTATPAKQSDPAADDITVLSPFQVTDSGSSGGGYKVSSTSTATRTNTPLINIPQTVDIMTEALWRDTAATTFQESFKFVPGAFVRDRNAGFGTVSLRGFENAQGFATDGIRTVAYKRDLAGYERLEVVKGPMPIQGRGGVGGLMNYILKKPSLARDFITLTTTIGHEESTGGAFYRGTLDYNKVIDSSKGLRVAVVGQQSDDYIDFMKHKIAGAYPSFRWKISPKTELVAMAEFLHANTPSREEGHGFNVYPGDVRRQLKFPAVYGAADQITALNIPFHTNAGGPDNTWVENTRTAFLILNQKVAEGMDFRQSVHFRKTDVDWHAWEILDNISQIQPVVWERQYNDASVFNLQGDFNASFKPLAWLKTTTLIGYQYDDNSGHAGRQTAVPIEAKYARLDLAELAKDPIGFFSTPRTKTSPVQAFDNALHTRNVGYYAQEDLEFFDRVILTGGVRRDKDSQNTDRRVTNDKVNTASQLTSWRVGAVAKLNPRLSLYAVKSLQNDPDLKTVQYTNLPASDPRSLILLGATRQNDLVEFGVKSEVLGGRVTVSAAHWQLKRKGNVVTLTTNENFTDPVTGLPAVRAVTQNIIADAETKGWEFSAFGDVTTRLTLIADYVSMDSVEPFTDPVTRVPSTRRLRFAPDWSAKIFGKYSFRDAKGEGWIVKVGASMLGPMAIQAPNGTGIFAASRYNFPDSQYTFDLGAAYRFGRWEADLQINNVGSDIVYQTRTNPLRQIRLTLTGRF